MNGVNATGLTVTTVLQYG